VTGNDPERGGRLVSVTWYGQAGFRLAAGDSRVLIDPFLTGRPDRRYEPPAAASDFTDITLVLCTHEHADHLDLPFLREFCAVNPAARIVVPLPVAEIAAAGGIDRARLAAAVPGEELIPMHYESIDGNTGDPGRFTALVRESGAPAVVLAPPRARPLLLALP
jgi:L-ascorbate metabolism protein UlaG (beta-lactamase superfamily)